MTIQNAKAYTIAALNAMKDVPGKTSDIVAELNDALNTINGYKPPLPDELLLMPDTSFWSVMYWDTDLKKWVLKYDFQKVKIAIQTLGIKTWITKLSQDGFVDSGAKIICDGLRSIGMPVWGGYHWFNPNYSIEIQVNVFVNAFRTFGIKQPIIDVEQVVAGIDKKTYLATLLKFLQRVEAELHIVPWVYSAAWVDSFVDVSDLTHYPLNVANYQVVQPALPKFGMWKDWAAWQYTDRLVIDGLLGGQDANYVKAKYLAV